LVYSIAGLTKEMIRKNLIESSEKNDLGKNNHPAITKPFLIANQDASKCPRDPVRLQAFLKAKQEKSVNESTPNTIAVMSAKKLAD
jgi:hypothetical protein